MPLNLIETDLENVQPEFHKLYVKDPKSKTFKLELPDLDSYVSSRVAPVEKELQIARANEHKLSISAALRKAGIDPHYESLVYANLRERVRLEISNDGRSIRVLQTDGETPMVGSGSNGLATLDDLAQEAVKTLPSAFKTSIGGMPSSVPMGDSKVLSRTEFEKLGPIERSKKMQDGYKLVDAQPAPTTDRPAPRPGEKTMTRAEFDQLSPKARSEKILQEGYRLIDEG